MKPRKRTAPEVRSPSGRYIAWPEVIHLASRSPGLWVRRFPDAPARLIDTIRQRRSPKLRRPDGHLEALGLNFTTDRDGMRRCDVLVRWIPHQTEVESSE